jgi:ppGpp synthetase/RelA/SpoT-type nucleotidyltranferase
MLSTLEEEYRKAHPRLTAFALELNRQIEQMLVAERIALAIPIEHRVKTWPSLRDKIERKRKALASIDEITDLVGMRVILLFQRDVTTVCGLLESALTVMETENTTSRLAEDQFGYGSVHYIVKVSAEWLSVPSMATFGNMQSEIQVRTMAQHIWAASSHVLQYKQEASVPASVRRAIFRVSALLETVDLEFERVLEERLAYRASIEANDSIEFLDDHLNVDLLERTLDLILPPANKDAESENLDELLGELRHFDIDTPRKVYELMDEHRVAVLAEEASALDREQKTLREGRFVEDPDRTARGVFYLHVGLIRQALRAKFGAAYDDYAVESSGNPIDEDPDFC